MHDDSHDHSVRDGIFDGSADDIADLHRDDDFQHFSRSRGRYRHRDLSGAPSWVKAFVWMGALFALAGFGVILFSILGGPDVPERISTGWTQTTINGLPHGWPETIGNGLPPGFPETIANGLPPQFPSARPEPPELVGPNVKLGFGLFFIGIVLSVVGALGHSTSRRR